MKSKAIAKSCNLHLRVQEYSTSATFKIEKLVQFDYFLCPNRYVPAILKEKQEQRFHETPFHFFITPLPLAKTQMKMQASQLVLVSVNFWSWGWVTIHNNAQFVFEK